MVRISAVVVLALAVSGCLLPGGEALDATLQAGSGGCDVIEAVLTKITLSNVFTEDYGFLRRIAYAASRGGQDQPAPMTAGPWAVSRSMLVATQAPTASLQSVRAAIYNSTVLQQFGGGSINWTTVTYEQLALPLFSAMTARLYIHMVVARTAGATATVPVRLDKQAEFWSKNFLSSTSADEEQRLQSRFTNHTRELDDQCACKANVDMAFVMDMSGSVGSSSFDLARQFAANIAGSFDVGPNATRIALITYSFSPTLNFNLQRYDTTAEAAAAIRAAPYLGGGTRTGAAISAMIQRVFLETLTTTSIPTTPTAGPTTKAPTAAPPQGGGEIPGGDIPGFTFPPQQPATTAMPAPVAIQSRVGIILTDGMSGDDVKFPSQLAHQLGITLFAIGVAKPDPAELRDIASDPDQAHLFYVGDYTIIESVRTSIRQRSCRASAPVDLGVTVTGSLQGNESQFVSIPLDANEPTITVSVSAEQGKLDFYASFEFPNPSAALNDFAGIVLEGASENFVLSNPNVQDSRRRRRQANAGSGGTLYVSVVGRSPSNQFTLQAKNGRVVAPSAPSASSAPSAPSAGNQLSASAFLVAMAVFAAATMRTL